MDTAPSLTKLMVQDFSQGFRELFREALALWLRGWADFCTSSKQSGAFAEVPVALSSWVRAKLIQRPSKDFN